MIDIVLLPLAPEDVAEMINDDVAVAELMGWYTPDTVWHQLPLLIRDCIWDDYRGGSGDIIFPVEMSRADFKKVRALGDRVSLAVKDRVFTALMRSIVAYIDEVDDADGLKTGAGPVS